MTQLLLTDKADYMNETPTTPSENHTLGTGDILRTDQEQNLMLWDACKRLHKGNAHSIAAHQNLGKTKSWQLQRVLKAIHKRGQAIAEDIEIALGDSVGRSTASARMADAKRLGLLERCGSGKTSSGRSAGMYRLTLLGLKSL